MSAYEFRCRNCQRSVTVEHPLGRPQPPAACTTCGNESFQRIYSRVAFHRSAASRLADVDLSRPPDEAYYRDTRNIGLQTEARLRQLGIDPSDQFRQVVETARTGELLATKTADTNK